MLCVAIDTRKLIAHQVIAQVIGSCGKRSNAIKCVIVHCADTVLSVVIVANVLACIQVQVALIVFVEDVRQFNIIVGCKLIVGL